jgi:adenylate cyclase
MRCSSCDHENRAKARFCAACGAALPRGCASCGAELPEHARFCDACGSPVEGGAAPRREPPSTPSPGSYTPRHLAEKILTSRSALEGERKLVTVLFADVAGFTSLSTRLDPEELHGIMDGCFQQVMESVHRYEGTVNQFTGDGVMALFGAPVAHEDHAVRAVAAALAIQRSLVPYAAEIHRTRGLDFGLRIGLNTGPVVVGKIGDDLRMDYTAQGETVNLAARLQQIARPGGVLVSEATHRLASRTFVTESQGEVVLKGIERAVPVYAVTGARTARARFDLALERGLTPLVGRDRELQFLQDCFERARAARGQVVSLVGDAGTGKSRLAYELHRRLEGVPHGFLRADCLPHGETAPFRVVVEFLRGILGLEAGEPEPRQVEKVEAGVARLDPALAWTLPYHKLLLALPAAQLDAEGLDQTQRKRRTLEAVKMLLCHTADERPQLLLVEDLQWIDPSSEEALRSLVDVIGDHRVLLVCTYRAGYSPPWHDRSFHQRLALEPLSQAEAGRMLDHLLAPAQWAPARALVLGRAEGNPFFVEELAGYLRSLGDPPTVASVEASMPQTVQDLLTARIDRLSDPLKRTLQRASVLGREFPLRLLEAISPAEEDVNGAAHELVGLELLHEKELFPELRLSFTQPLVRDVAYEGLLLKARADLHGRAGRALERLYADRLDEVLHDLARHYARSGEAAQALRYRIRAADRAASLFAYEEAEAHCREALDLIDGATTLAAERPGVLDRLGDTRFARGQLTIALERWREALAASGGDAGPLVADLERKIAVASWAAGDRDGAAAALGRGLEALGGNRDSLAAARIHQELGRIRFRLGDGEGATVAAEQALDLGRRLGAPDVVSHACNTLGIVLARAGAIERGAQFVAQSLETALEHGLAAAACRAYTNLAVMYATLDPRRSEQYCRQGLELARKIGDQLQESWLCCAMAGGHCTIEGDFDEGVKAAEQAAEIDRRLGQRSHLPIPLIILAQIHQCRGAFARSAEYYRQALEIAETMGEPQLLVPCYEGLATMAIEEGKEEDAEQWIARSRDVGDSGGETFLLLPFLC